MKYYKKLYVTYVPTDKYDFEASFDPVQKYKESRDKTCETRNSHAQDKLWLFDLLILRTFHDVTEGKDQSAITYLQGPKLAARKTEIVNDVMTKVDILFLQEAAQYNKKAQEINVHPPEIIDTAILLKKSNSPMQDLIGNWEAFIDVQKTKKENMVYLPGGENFRAAKDENIWIVKGTAVAITEVGRHEAMLMSMHPKSNGRPCVLFAAMARDFFEEQRGGNHKNLKFLVVGMDANVLVESDWESKQNEAKKMGFKWSDFQTRATELGFTVVFQEKTNTVYKQRTFLQTQLPEKAAKLDKTIKDIMLVYTNPSIAITMGVGKAEVVNWADAPEDTRPTVTRESTIMDPTHYGYINDYPFPTNNWPMDHFLTVSSINTDITNRMATQRNTRGKGILAHAVRKVLRTLIHGGLAKA